jgi:hypothetical protein
MTRFKHAFRSAVVAPAMVEIVAGGVASCVAPPSPPRKVEESKPSVTYKYRGDSELIAATRRAEDYCRGYGALPRTVNITDDPDGSSTVVFDCDRTLVAVVPPAAPPKPSVSYTYRSDRELVDATGTAASYCRTYNAPPRMATITSNADGTKTVVFDCGP